MSEERQDGGESGDPVEDRAERYRDVDTSHLDDVADGCGCAEVWEHTSGKREESGAD